MVGMTVAWSVEMRGDGLGDYSVDGRVGMWVVWMAVRRVVEWVVLKVDWMVDLKAEMLVAGTVSMRVD
jgi:uncharacterized protein with PhoU and TrkA domain